MKKLLSILLAAAMIMSFIVVPAAAEETTHTHCWCEGAENKPADHVCDETVEWTAVAQTGNKFEISANGYYYLDFTGVDAAKSIIIGDGLDVYLCLNGSSIRAQTCITIGSGSSLTVCDCVGSGVISTTKYSPVTLAEGQTMTLMSGSISGTYKTTASRVSVTVSGGTFNMYGGSIKDGCTNSDATNKDTTFGGNVRVSTGSFNMYGGTITGGNAGSYGGNVAITDASGAFNMYGGTITGGTAATHGGNISCLNGAFTMEGGTVTSGNSGSQGGNIAAASGGTVTIKGGTVSTGSAGSYGGNISANNAGTIIIEGGATITGGTATTHGGNIAVAAPTSSVTVSGGTIENGTATEQGGNLSTSAGSITVSGTASVKGGNSTTYGGNVAITGTDSTFTMTGGTVSDGTSTTYGGNIGIGGGAVAVEGGTIENGTAATHGGNIGQGSGSFTMTGGTVTGGSAVSGAGMSMQNAATAVITGGEFTNSGIYFHSTGSLTVGGTANIYAVYHCFYGGKLLVDETVPFTGVCGIVMEEPQDFLATETDYTANFISRVAGYGVAFTGTAMTLNPYAARVGSTYYFTLQDAIDNVGDSYVRLVNDVTEDVTVNGDLYLDLNGKTLTGNLTGTGTLNGIDRSGDSYETPTGAIVGTVECKVSTHIKTDVTGSIKRYMAIGDSTGYTFHRYYLGITHISLKPGTTGMGYKAVFHTDEQVQAQLSEEGAFGYTMQVEGSDPVSLSLDASEFESGKVVTLRLDNVDIANYGTTPVIGKVFLKFGDTVVESSSYSYSMQDMVETVDAAVAADAESFTAEQMTALQALCATWSAAMADWNISNILSWTAAE